MAIIFFTLGLRLRISVLLETSDSYADYNNIFFSSISEHSLSSIRTKVADLLFRKFCSSITYSSFRLSDIF
jgi:hypothetical protein